MWPPGFRQPSLHRNNGKPRSHFVSRGLCLGTVALGGPCRRGRLLLSCSNLSPSAAQVFPVCLAAGAHPWLHHAPHVTAQQALRPLVPDVAITPACFQLGPGGFPPRSGFLVFAFVCPPCHGTTGPTPPCSRRLHHLQLACSLAWCSPSVCFSVPKFFLGCRGTQSSLQRSRLCAWHHLRHLSSLSFASNCPSALGSLQTTPSWRLTALAIDDQPRLCTYHGAQFDSYMGPS